MIYFYIDTSSSYLYAAIINDNKLLSEIKQNFGSDLSKFAISEIKKMFEEAKIKPNDVDKIIVVSGPGSFTGIRIGMTFAKIFAWSFKKEITSITSLEAMATSISSKSILVPLIDARRGYVYAGVYQNNQMLLQNQYIEFTKLKEYLDNLKKDYYFITNDKNFKFDNQFGYNPDFLKIVDKYGNKKVINPHLIEPEYLKLTEAEENVGSNKNDN